MLDIIRCDGPAELDLHAEDSALMLDNEVDFVSTTVVAKVESLSTGRLSAGADSQCHQRLEERPQERAILSTEVVALITAQEMLSGSFK